MDAKFDAIIHCFTSISSNKDTVDVTLDIFIPAPVCIWFLQKHFPLAKFGF